MTSSARPDGPAVDPRHLLIIGAGPGLGGAIARRFAQGGYHLTLLARTTDGLDKLAGDLTDAGAAVDTVAADASDPEGLRTTLTSVYASPGAPGVLVYNASMLTPDSLLSSGASPASPSPGRSGRAHHSARTRLQRSTSRSCNQRPPGNADSASTEHGPPAWPHHLAAPTTGPSSESGAV